MTRLSERYSILFVEEPKDPDEAHPQGHVKQVKINDHLTVFTPYIPWHNWPTMCSQYVPLLKKHVDAIEASAFWFYSPYYVHLLKSFNPGKVIYDCMDEHSAFKNASPNLPAYERQLLGRAEVVFTGGRSLYEAKRDLHNNVHCFPSSVDSEHFEKAMDAATEVPEDLQEVKRPVVGYYGVIDERIDMDLLAKTAQLLPDVSLIMIGPFAKIDKKEAAKADNIHYLGKKDYALLPGYLKGMDVAMMPFALNESTRYISPTKTLEYMAALKPIVSTPVRDVVREYKGTVAIEDNATSFAEAIRAYLQETEEQKQSRKKLQAEKIKANSWNKTVEEMERLAFKDQGKGNSQSSPSKRSVPMD
ncbi:glycosyltransferase involved in cell wall biosynthesis [Pontibacter ummariensis]|uniref:Glycosyltransferase involved in cell wall bisynthesis n=1 Tax=Pontibacter ummariensis TaxID=1610492 RepID=A0A239FF09_9BACT|nr:glycosyltransferase [Pontibacter ummariensis]PRY12289.1 glycosyltransferase involved in cell wall biosynthesis [Pontibacter ummariensis]SNS55351.1 Glycosyltransferase involved in cell wall bisynthesis [Pontibacter ummariensis]